MRMTAAAQPVSADRSDVRTILVAGIQLGILTTIGVVAFVLLARALAGTTAVIVQAALILAGGVVFAFGPARAVRPRSIDGIAWAALVGLLGALVFSVLDVAVLRPVHLYPWTWDAIGGGSGFWYLPVWWMGSAVLAWLGSWVVALAARGGREPSPLVSGLLTAGIGIVLLATAAGTGLLPFGAPAAALAFAVALVLHVPIAAAVHRQ
jgi:hypothetical protein